MNTLPETLLQAQPLRLSTTQADFEQAFVRRLHWSADTDAAIEQRVADILADVRTRGDAAVLEYTARFDGLQAARMQELELTQADFKNAFESLPAEQQQALQAAAARVRSYHEMQKKHTGEGWSYRDADGSLLGQKVTPLDRVGIYVPGGKAAYPSSLIMNAVPAHVAGVQDIIMVVPTPVRGSVAAGGAAVPGDVPAANAAHGERNPLVLAAAYVAGVNRAFTIGGAQAIAALAYGTATVPKVDKITGPGNAYVASAKRRVFGTVGIDMIAGPSEILVLADGSTPAEWVAMDLFSQAEHDELAQAVLLCPDADYIDAVQREMQRMPIDSVELILCSGGDLIASQREQWNDGSNTLCIKPGVIVVYDRNEVTNELLTKKGLTVLEMKSSELSRGRGGPRCMSMPLVREE